jgi:hypothetical protein
MKEWAPVSVFVQGLQRWIFASSCHFPVFRNS